MPNTLYHKRSAVKDKTPSASTISYGEICINYNKDNEFIALKNSGNEVVKIKAHNMAADISFDTDSHASTVFTGTNVETAIAQVEQTVLDNESVCSEAYNSLDTRLSNKQDTLTSGTNIKTINGESLLGSGNLEINTSVTADSSLSSASTNPVQNKVIYTALAGKSDTGHTHTKSQITDFPIIPTVNNPTITINQGGISKGSFSLNQTTGATIELTDSDTTYEVATQTTDGLMSSADKIKLDNLSGDNGYTVEELSSAMPTVDLQPNHIYDLTSSAITTITIQQTTANADDFKSKEAIVRFMAASTVPTISVTLGSSPVRWQGGAIPVFQANCYYELSFIYVLGGYNIAMQTFKEV